MKNNPVDDSPMHPLKTMLHLNMICVHPKLVDENSMEDIRSSGKLMELAKLLLGSGVISDEGT